MTTEIVMYRTTSLIDALQRLKFLQFLYNIVLNEGDQTVDSKPIITLKMKWWDRINTEGLIYLIIISGLFTVLFGFGVWAIIVFFVGPISIYLLLMGHSYREWTAESVSLYKDRIIHSVEGREQTTFPLNGECVIETYLRPKVLDCQGDHDIGSRDDLIEMKGVNIIAITPGIMMRWADEELYVSSKRGWKDEDVQRLWVGLCHVLPVNDEVVLGRGLRCLIVYLRYVLAESKD